MRIARTIGLAVVAALALMASVGMGSASAAETTLCTTSTDSPYCQSKDRYSSGTVLKAATSSKFKIDNEVIAVKCQSSLEGKTGATAGDPLPVSISAWSMSSCTFSCTVKIVELPNSGSLKWTSGSEGTLALRVGASQPQMHVACFGIFECIWSMPDAVWKGGSPGQLVVPESKLVLVSNLDGKCPKEATLKELSYTVNSPSAAYPANGVSAEAHTRLCKAAEETCSMANTYPVNTKFEATAPKITIYTSTFTNYYCTETTFSALTQAVGEDWLPLGSSVQFEAYCNSGWGFCTLKPASQPFTGRAAGINKGEPGVNSALFSFDHAFTLRLQCGKSVDCVFDVWGEVTLNGGNPATFSYVKYPIKRLSGEACPANGTYQLSADFSITNPKPLYAV